MFFCYKNLKISLDIVAPGLSLVAFEVEKLFLDVPWSEKMRVSPKPVRKIPKIRHSVDQEYLNSRMMIILNK